MVSSSELRRPKVLIGIPSFRRSDGLQELLRSLAAQVGVDAFDIEIFVADSDSRNTDARDVCVKLAPNFRWALSCQVVEKSGISAARNAILDEARARHADFVAMLDDDEITKENWLGELLRVQKATGADVTGGPVHRQLPPTGVAIEKSGIFPKLSAAEGFVHDLSGTGNVMFACDSLQRMNWPHFDEAFGLTGGEDKEYFARLRKAGASFAWAPSARATEDVPRERATKAAILRRAFRIGNTDIRILKIHGTPFDQVVSLTKAGTILVTAPLCAPLLLLPSRRLWLLAKLWRAAGKFSAILGHQRHDYGSTDA